MFSFNRTIFTCLSEYCVLFQILMENFNVISSLLCVNGMVQDFQSGSDV